MDFASKKTATSPKQYKDYRRLLEAKDVDAVVIATPDHWHALQTIHACEAGKDVYVEKPLSLCVAEGRRMVEAVRKHGRVCQVGIHRRSVPVCKEATDLVRRGGLGKVTVQGTGGHTTGTGNIGVHVLGTINSSGGDVQVTGFGAGTGTSGSTRCVRAWSCSFSSQSSQTPSSGCTLPSTAVQ